MTNLFLFIILLVITFMSVLSIMLLIATGNIFFLVGFLGIAGAIKIVDSIQDRK